MSYFIDPEKIAAALAAAELKRPEWAKKAAQADLAAHAKFGRPNPQIIPDFAPSTETQITGDDLHTGNVPANRVPTGTDLAHDDGSFAAAQAAVDAAVAIRDARKPKAPADGGASQLSGAAKALTPDDAGFVPLYLRTTNVPKRAT